MTIRGKMYYKYRPYNDYTKSLLRDGVLWLSRVSSLNDPFEGDFGISEKDIKETILALPDGLSGEESENAISIVQGFRSGFRNTHYILSLSKEPNDIVMWSHYADNHTGIVIGFEFSNLIEESFSQAVKSAVFYKDDKYIHDVIYSNEPLIFDLMKVKNSGYKKMLLQKSKQWKYEKEARLLIEDKEINDKGISLEIKPQCIREIRFGARTPQENIDEVKRMMKGKSVEFKQMEMAHGHFTMYNRPV